MSDVTMLIVLLAAAVVLIVIILVVLFSGRYPSDEDDGFEMEEEYEAEPAVSHPKSHKQQPEKHVEHNRKKEPAKKPLQWKLILENLNSWEKYTYIFYNNIGIGRAEPSNQFEKYLVIEDDARVSKVHCEIYRKKDSLYLRDKDSRNGTYLNGTRIQGPAILQKDDVIGVGATKIEVKRVLRERE